jgi:L-ascorbate metabolism protein UlaG (beta-lactamase superfamily)
MIPMRTKLDLAILPVGDNFTMDIEDAIVASDFIECDKVLGYHYDTFGYIEIDHKAAIQKFSDKGKDLMLKIGENRYKHDLGSILSACRMVSSVTISFIPSRVSGLV